MALPKTQAVFHETSLLTWCCNMDFMNSVEAFRSLPYFDDIAAVLRQTLNLPDNYAQLEQASKLSSEQVEALVVYRLLIQEDV